jgi:hypothetical protein
MQGQATAHACYSGASLLSVNAVWRFQVVAGRAKGLLSTWSAVPGMQSRLVHLHLLLLTAAAAPHLGAPRCMPCSATNDSNGKGPASWCRQAVLQPWRCLAPFLYAQGSFGSDSGPCVCLPSIHAQQSSIRGGKSGHVGPIATALHQVASIPPCPMTAAPTYQRRARSCSACTSAPASSSRCMTSILACAVADSRAEVRASRYAGRPCSPPRCCCCW